MLTKADEARIANEKARIKDLVSTEVLASYDTTGKLDKEQLLANLNNIPAEVTDLTNDKNFAWDLTFKVDGYNVTIKENGTVIVGDETGEGESSGETTPDLGDKTLTGITLSPSTIEVNEGETETLTATKDPVDANDTLKFESNDTGTAIVEATDGKTATIKGVKAGTTKITVSGTKTGVTAECTVTVNSLLGRVYFTVDGTQYWALMGYSWKEILENKELHDPTIPADAYWRFGAVWWRF